MIDFKKREKELVNEWTNLKNQEAGTMEMLKQVQIRMTEIRGALKEITEFNKGEDKKQSKKEKKDEKDNKQIIAKDNKS